MFAYAKTLITASQERERRALSTGDLADGDKVSEKVVLDAFLSSWAILSLEDLPSVIRQQSTPRPPNRQHHHQRA